MSNTSSVLEFKSSTFFTPILILFSNEIAAIEQTLQDKISLAPDFFKNSPLIIDVRELNKSALEVNVAEIVDMLRMIGLFPIGLRGGNEQQNKQAQKLSIPVDAGRDIENNLAVQEQNQQKAPDKHSAESTAVEDVGTQEKTAETAVSKTLDATEKSAPQAVPVRAMIIAQPVRSGQRIYAQGDLVVMSQVSAGAEIMAEGNIHVYNTLRGRALAGVQGNTSARIFCLDLQAELVSIAGDYKTSEHMTKQLQKKPVQVYLQDHALIIKEIA
ncbi:MAG: septum site-determining protein MinC [Burkholderiales bacterium]|nr:septum site-determining protein MinC [Nitrosomonas sp.]MCP5275144.1 septum site-determining protein MinC [Burkholderiales bacterium]